MGGKVGTVKPGLFNYKLTWILSLSSNSFLAPYMDKNIFFFLKLQLEKSYRRNFDLMKYENVKDFAWISSLNINVSMRPFYTNFWIKVATKSKYPSLRRHYWKYTIQEFKMILNWPFSIAHNKDELSLNLRLDYAYMNKYKGKQELEKLNRWMFSTK